MSDTLAETLPAHAPLGPSSAEGWMTCADYVNANRGLPDCSTQPAAEGTAAHSISDMCLALGLDAADVVGFTTDLAGFRFVWDDEDAMLLQNGIDRVRDLTTGLTFYGERRVGIQAWTLPDQFGTLDRAWIALLDGEWWICVEDLKWGRGIAVSPVRNKQIMLYALGFWRDVAQHVLPAGTVPRFRLSIDQPRHGGGGGVWVTTLPELEAFGEEAKTAAALTSGPDAPRTASLKGCMWCRRRRAPGGCDSFDRYMIALLGLDWSDIDLGVMMSEAFSPPRELTPERRSWLLLHKDSIRRWLDQLDEEAMEDARAGRETGLIKAVEGNKLPDKWRDKGVDAIPVVERILGDAGFNRRLRTPKQISEAVEGDEEASKAIAAHIDRGDRRPILVPLQDARDAITPAAAFEELPSKES